MKSFIFWIFIGAVILGLIFKLESARNDSELGRIVLMWLGAALGFYCVYKLKTSLRWQREGDFGDQKDAIVFWKLAILIASLIVCFIGGWGAFFVWGLGLFFFYYGTD